MKVSIPINLIDRGLINSVVLGPPPSSATVIFKDTFTDIAGTAINSHIPDISPGTFTWLENSGLGPIPYIDALGRVGPLESAGAVSWEASNSVVQTMTYSTPIEINYTFASNSTARSTVNKYEGYSYLTFNFAGSGQIILYRWYGADSFNYYVSYDIEIKGHYTGGSNTASINIAAVEGTDISESIKLIINNYNIVISGAYSAELNVHMAALGALEYITIGGRNYNYGTFISNIDYSTYEFPIGGNFLDTFSSGSDLSSHVSDSGHSYGTPRIYSGGLYLSSDALISGGYVHTNNTSHIIGINDWKTPSEEMFIEAIVNITSPVDTPQFEIYLTNFWHNNSGVKGWILYLDHNGSGLYRVNLIGESDSDYSDYYANTAISLGTNITIRLEYTAGNTMKLFVNTNLVSTLTVADLPVFKEMLLGFTQSANDLGRVHVLSVNAGEL